MKVKKSCPHCRLYKPMTTHHIYPHRHFGNGLLTFDLCRKCHDKLELLIPYKISSKYEYIKIMLDFLQTFDNDQVNVCPKCREQKELVSYKVFPKRYFDKRYRELEFKICAECIDGLEVRIPRYNVNKFEYAIIFFTYMAET